MITTKIEKRVMRAMNGVRWLVAGNNDGSGVGVKVKNK